MKHHWKSAAVGVVAISCVAALIAPTTAGAISDRQVPNASIGAFESSPVPAFGTAGNAAFDWAERALAFDEFAYDWTNRGDFTTIMEDTTAYNMPAGETSFKMPAYWGDERIQRLGDNNGDGYQESVTHFSSIISATLIGIDKSNQECNKPNLPTGVTTCNYVDMLRTFVHEDIGIAGNTPLLGKTGDGKFIPGTRDGWYQFLPNVLYYAVGSLYPDAKDMDQILRGIADNYDAMVRQIGGAHADFNMQDYDFELMRPIVNSSWNQATDIGAATAAVLLWAHDHFGDAKYLQTAKWTMDAMDRSDENRYYEIITMLLPYLAARMNATHGTNYDVAKYLHWLQYDSVARSGWGTIGGYRTGGSAAPRWDGRTVSGLSGSLNDEGFDGDPTTRDYPFAMNSFVTPWLAATVKYDTQYANAIGRWLLNVNTSARWFFSDQVGPHQQEGVVTDQETGVPGSSTGWKTDKRAGAIAYEGLQPHSTVGILATADVTHPERSGGWNLGPESTNLGLYGSGWIGFMSTIKPTNVPDVLRTDLNALDHFGTNDYPTSLIYNPTEAVANVEIALEGSHDLYDAVTGTYLARNVAGTTTVAVPANGSVVLVELPAGASLSHDGYTVLANDAPIAYSVDPHRDLALDTTVTVAPARVNEAVAASVVDGDLLTGWASESDQVQTVTVDLAGQYRVGKALIAWGKNHPENYTIATSTNRTIWTTASAISSQGGQEEITFTPRDARYLRVVIPADTVFDLRGIETYIADLARNKSVTVSGTANIFHGGTNLTDGSSHTRWESRALNDEWARVDLGQVQSVGSVRINWEGAYGRDFRIEVSDDGNAWTSAAAVTGGTGGDQIVTLDEDTEARYVRWVGVQRGTEWSYSMWDLEVYAPENYVRVGDIPAPDEPTMTTATLTLSSRTVVADSAQPITANVAVTSSSDESPQGTIALVENGSVIAQTPLAGTAVSLTIPTSLGVGDYAVAAEFRSADETKWRSSRTTTQVIAVNAAPVTVTVTNKRAVAGKKVTATVRVATPGTWWGGRVQITGWGKKTRSVTVPASGVATVRLPAVKRKTNRTITASVATTARLTPAVTRHRIRIVKARPKVNVRAKRNGNRVTLRINVKKPKRVSAKGKARVFVAGKRVRTVQVDKKGRARAVVTVRSNANTKMNVRFLGNKGLKKRATTLTVRSS